MDETFNPDIAEAIELMRDEYAEAVADRLAAARRMDEVTSADDTDPATLETLLAGFRDDASILEADLHEDLLALLREATRENADEMENRVLLLLDEFAARVEEIKARHPFIDASIAMGEAVAKANMTLFEHLNYIGSVIGSLEEPTWRGIA